MSETTETVSVFITDHHVAAMDVSMPGKRQYVGGHYGWWGVIVGGEHHGEEVSRGAIRSAAELPPLGSVVDVPVRVERVTSTHTEVRVAS